MPYKKLIFDYFYAFACIAGPVFFFFGLFQRLVAPPATSLMSGLAFTPLNSAKCAEDSINLGGNLPFLGSHLLSAANLSGYYTFAITSTFLIAVCIVTISISVCYIWRQQRHAVWVRWLFLAALVILGRIGWKEAQSTHGMRDILILPIFDAHPFGRYFQTPSPQIESIFSILAQTKMIININVALVPVAGMAVLLALAGMSGPSDPSVPTAKSLERRLFAMRVLLGLVSAALSLTVFASHASGVWVLGLLCKSDANALVPIVTAVSNYWGAGTSGVILCGFTPALAKWLEDRRMAEATAGLSTEKERHDWRDREGLVFAPQAGLVSLVAAVFPALAAPLSNAFQFLG